MRSLRRSEAFVPMGNPELNRLSRIRFDPHSWQPGYKACAVFISKRAVTRLAASLSNLRIH